MPIKPEAPNTGFWLPGDVFTADTRSRAVRELAQSPLNEDQQRALMQHAEDQATMMMQTSTSPAAQQRAQLEAVASDARRLLHHLAALNETARAILKPHAEYLALCAPGRLNERAREFLLSGRGRELFELAWDVAEALEAVTDYAAGECSGTRQDKPDQDRLRAVVAELAREVHRLAGRLPPKDGAAWFAGFVAVLAESFGQTAGPRLIAGAIDSAR